MSCKSNKPKWPTACTQLSSSQGTQTVGGMKRPPAILRILSDKDEVEVIREKG